MKISKNLIHILISLKVNTCSHAEGADKFMESSQCLGYSRYRNKVTRDLCAPPQDEIVSAVKKKIVANEAKFLFVATDNNPMMSEFREILDPLNVS